MKNRSKRTKKTDVTNQQLSSAVQTTLVEAQSGDLAQQKDSWYASCSALVSNEKPSPPKSTLLERRGNDERWRLWNENKYEIELASPAPVMDVLDFRLHKNN